MFSSGRNRRAIDVYTFDAQRGRKVTGGLATSGTLDALATWRSQLAIIDMDITNAELFNEFADLAIHADRIPIIALTRRGDLQTKLAAFDAGVDDILTVPFLPEELVARLLAIMRRTYGQAVVFTPVLRQGELDIDILHRRVVAAGAELHLTSLEQSLLDLLAANAGRLLTRDEILDHLWGVDYVAASTVVDRHIRNLCVKLQNAHRRANYNATVPGQGYRFVPTSEEPSSAG